MLLLMKVEEHWLTSDGWQKCRFFSGALRPYHSSVQPEWLR